MNNGIWYSPEGDRPCLPKYLFPFYAKLTHGKDRVSKGGMLSVINKYWQTKGFSNYSQRFCQQCVIHAKNNAGWGQQMPPAVLPTPEGPFEHLQMDFIDLTPSEGKSHCLVIVDMWSKRVEAYPTAKVDAGTVARILITEIIPGLGKN